MKRGAKTRKETASEMPCMIAWHVIERGEKTYWTRIGAAWEHHDRDGITLQLDLTPTNGGRIVLRNRADDEE